MQKRIFVTGGTGYMGRALTPMLIERGHKVTTLVRTGSEAKVKGKCNVVTGNVLEGESYSHLVPGHDTFVHLVGVPHPSPAKARQFVQIDLRAAKEAIRVAVEARIGHFVYVSVAQPAPVMKAYQAVRAEAEITLRASGLNATILRPWYVLGPGHWWPVMLKPVYSFAAVFPNIRQGALRLGLVSLEQMVRTLGGSIEAPACGVRVLEVPEIRRLEFLGLGTNSQAA